MNYVKVPLSSKHVCVRTCSYPRAEDTLTLPGPRKVLKWSVWWLTFPLKEETVQPYEYLYTNYSTRADTSLVYAIHSTRI